MLYKESNIFKSLDWFTILLYIVLVLAGWISIYAASYNFDSASIFDLSSRAGKQMLWILSSIILAFVIFAVNREWFEAFSPPMYIITLLILIITIFIAPDIKGSRSWLYFGPVQIQPAEFAKFTTTLFLAKAINDYKPNLRDLKNLFIFSLIIIIPILIIILQKETGSALVYLAFFIVLYREGMSGKILLVGFFSVLYFIIGLKYSDIILGKTSMGTFLVTTIAVVVANIQLWGYSKSGIHKIILSGATGGILLLSFVIAYFVPFDLSVVSLVLLAMICLYLFALSYLKWSDKYLQYALFGIFAIAVLFSENYLLNNVLEEHQRVRIQVTLGTKDDPGGAGYNVNQSKIAIGSGGFTGKGFLNGTQTKLNYVPEQSTDFVFCTIGEEEGFIGSVIILILFFLLIARIIHLAERQDTTFGRVYGYCVASIIFFHVAINVGMVIGITPVIGIPLPFISYGGSSLWSFTILLFTFLRIDSARNVYM